MIAITHIITGLERGGAEMMLYKLVQRHARCQRFSVEVVSLTSEGDMASRIKRCGVPVHVLGARRGIPNPWIIGKLVRRLRSSAPDVVQTWMYHADLIGGLASKLAGSPAVAWGIRQSNLDPDRSKKLTVLTAKVCAQLSAMLPNRIVCCSDVAARIHQEMGYAGERMIVIPNGFDLESNRSDLAARVQARMELGIGMDEPVIGMVARFDPQKDHETFVQAAALLVARVPRARFVLVGNGIAWENRELVGYLEAAAVRQNFHLLGIRDDIPRLLNAFDIASLSSAFGEGFPNVVGEAMACEIPCVVTDVGDSAYLVGDTGRVVPPRDSAALAGAWSELISCDSALRRRLGAAARDRIRRHFDIDQIADKYAALYEQLASSSLPGASRAC